MVNYELPYDVRAFRCVIAVLFALFVSVLVLSASPQADGFFLGGSDSRAFAATHDGLTVGSTDSDVKPMSSGFKASTYKLDLSPKVKKIPYGHKYVKTYKTVTIKIPDSSYYPVTWKSSNPKVATATDSYKAREMKLTVCGRSHGKSTITITNSATYESIKIHVVVNGYDSKDFRASKTKLNLTAKKAKVSGGLKYTAGSQTITVGLPDGAGWKCASSDDSIASTTWDEKYIGNTIKIKVTGHRNGKATLTFTNTKTKKKVKVQVTVGGAYGLGFKWGSPEKKQGKSGNYWLDNFSLVNGTGKLVTLDKNCAFRCWAINPNFEDDYDAWLDDEDGILDKPEYYTAENEAATIRGMPITIKKGACKKVYIGENNYDYDKDTDGVWEKGILTVKVDKSYKTIYVDDFGMVTKVLNGRKI